MIAAVTCARLGSKRLPGKVLATAGGRTLLEWTLDFARALGVTCYVFTPDAAVMAHVRNRAPIIWEPHELLRDGVTYETMRYCNAVARADHLVLLQPTQPLRSVRLARSWLSQVERNQYQLTRVVSGGEDTGIMYTFSREYLEYRGDSEAHDFEWPEECEWFDIDTSADLRRFRAWARRERKL